MEEQVEDRITHILAGDDAFIDLIQGKFMEDPIMKKTIVKVHAKDDFFIVRFLTLLLKKENEITKGHQYIGFMDFRMVQNCDDYIKGRWMEEHIKRRIGIEMPLMPRRRHRDPLVTRDGKQFDIYYNQKHYGRKKPTLLIVLTPFDDRGKVPEEIGWMITQLTNGFIEKFYILLCDP